MIRHELKAIADRQHGYFTARQALSAGYIKRQHAYHAKCEHWLKIDRGLFRLPGYEHTLESEFVRWSLWAIGRSPIRSIVVSHESALFYYGLCEQCPQSIHFSVPANQTNKEENSRCVFHRQDLTRTEILMRPGYAITTPERTLRDMKPVLLLQSCWVESVQRALGKQIISDPDAREMLGSQLYRQEIPVGFGAVAIGRAGARSGQNAVHDRSTSMKTLYPVAQRGGWIAPTRSFTLVEMLVVVAIIVALSALLMPALLKAQGQAYQVQCASNLKQIALGEALYGQAYHGWFSGPDLNFFRGASSYNVRTSNWETLVVSQIDPQVSDWTSYKQYYQYGSSSFNGGGVMRCPEMRLTRGSAGIDRSARYNFVSYMMMGRSGTDNGGYGAGLNGVRMSGVRSPSKTAMFLDGPGDSLRCGQATTQYRFYVGIAGGYTQEQIVLDLVEYAHMNTANVAMVDGHVQSVVFTAPMKTEEPAFYNSQ